MPDPKRGGTAVHLPYSLSPPRPDKDKSDSYCMTCDFAVSTRTYGQVRNNSAILKMVVDSASAGLTAHYLQNHEEVSKDYKVLERMACKGGTPMPMSVRAEMLRD